MGDLPTRICSKKKKIFIVQVVVEQWNLEAFGMNIRAVSCRNRNIVNSTHCPFVPLAILPLLSPVHLYFSSAKGEHKQSNIEQLYKVQLQGEKELLSRVEERLDVEGNTSRFAPLTLDLALLQAVVVDVIVRCSQIPRGRNFVMW